MAGFVGMKWSQTAADIWHCEKPGEATGDVAASVIVEASGFKESGREIEVWHCVAGSESLNKDWEKSSVRLLPWMEWKPQYSGNLSTMEQPPKTAAVVEGSQPEPVRCIMCVLYARARVVEPLKSPKPRGV